MIAFWPFFFCFSRRALLSRTPSTSGGSSGSINQVLEALRLHPQLTSKIQATIHRTDTTDAQKVHMTYIHTLSQSQSRPDLATRQLGPRLFIEKFVVRYVLYLVHASELILQSRLV